MKLVLLHGRSQQDRDEVELKQEWIAALNEGLKKSKLSLDLSEEDIIFPYYGKMLMKLINDRDSFQENVVKKGSGGIDPEFAHFCADFLGTVAANAGITDQRIAELSELDVTEKGPQNWPWVLAILRAIDSESDFAQATLWAITNDVFHYLRNPVIRKTIDDFVAKSLPKEGEKCVWVGHSLGSVITYNILSKYKIKNIKEIITIGSPLGMKVIKRNLESPLLNPPCSVSGWYNAFDKKDAVSLFPLESPYFTTDPTITNYNKVLNGTSNKHGIEGYLNDKEVALRIYNAITK
ncbi:hypothetical protein [Sphingobacterium siyangense]|uniref:hypothetical protein n=1 Tax=Sphingobacterium siyangense TaxID=459529 RepID=UPI00196392B0|nr:hypothetical protein [Sphingobacterium siyangense]QRY55978.1 hypothetical protein JVX97_18335 [Sphingobacterium siyangense]